MLRARQSQVRCQKAEGFRGQGLEPRQVSFTAIDRQNGAR